MSNKVVIYTAITSGYDELRAIDNVCPGVDYVCFVDGRILEREPKPWLVREAPKNGLKGKDLARFCKMMASTLLPGYDKSIWIDGNIEITGNINEFLALSDKAILSVYNHWGRENLASEFYECALLAHDYAWTLSKQLGSYLKLPFNHNELFETNILYRDHTDLRIREFENIWWKEYCSKGKRDQYSFTYSAYKADAPIFSLGQHDARLINRFFTYHNHLVPRTRGVKLRLKKMMNLIYMWFVGWRK